MPTTMTDKASIESDGITVWVNSNEGYCIGRFGRGGIDIHRDACDQSENGECLYCTHAMTTAADWSVFVAKMDELYSIQVGEEHCPVRFRRKV